MIFDNIRIKPKLLFLFIMTGIVPLAIVAIVGSYSASTALMDQAFDHLRTIQNIKRDKIKAALDERANNLKLLAASRDAQRFLEDLHIYAQNNQDAQQDLFSLSQPEYQRIHLRYDAQLTRFMQANNFQNIYVLSREDGRLMYAAQAEDDLGTSLATGPYQSSALGRIWFKTTKTESLSFEDFEPYEPSHSRYAAFLGYPIRDSNGLVAGVLAVQLGTSLINQAMPSRQGMGDTGESYLVRYSEHQKRFVLRSDLQTLGHGQYSIGYILDQTPSYWHTALDKGFDGGTGVYADSAGQTVLAAYNALDIFGTTWILISKINKSEVISPIFNFFLVISATGVVLIILITPGAFAVARRIGQPLEQGVRFAEAISAGDLQARLELNQKDELGMLAKALNRMARNLRDINWLSQGKAGMDDTVRGEHDTQELSRIFIEFLTTYLKAQVGLVYMVSGEELVLVASYAYSNRQGNLNRVRMGEGLVGQAALEQKILTFHLPTEHAPSYHFGVGEKIPSHFIAAPLRFKDKVQGVFLLGSETAFSPIQCELVEQVAPNVAILLNTAKSQEVIAGLLRQAQEQQKQLHLANEDLEEQTEMLKASQAELQTQQEELQVTNEELAEQTRALKASEARLQEQQAELQFANDKLGERAMELEEQKSAIRAKNKDLLRIQRELKHKAEELEVASKYKSEFLANMSHELRTPLNSILILSQLLANNKDMNLTPKQVESARAIHSSGADLLKLINEILDLSKVEAGRIELHLESLSFSSMSADLRRIFSSIAAEKGLEFVIDQDESLPLHMLTDGHRLQQILRNLLSNAIKFTEKGAVTLRLGRPAPEANLSASGLDPAHTIALDVIDQGIGIAPEKQASVFEAFRQADGSTSRKYGGTGLGLAISRELAKLLGGEIQLASTVGQGSTFTLFLPETHPAAPSQTGAQSEPQLSETPDTPHPEPAQPDQPQASAQPYVQDDRKRIRPEDLSLLVIEDDPLFATILRDQGRDHGFKVLTAADGETGLHFADYYAPSAIILDVELPSMDGWAVMERLKRDPRTRHIPVYFISATDSSLEAIRLGALGFITKPVDVERIQQILHELKSFIFKKSKRLLVVDDDDLQREAIRDLIGSDGVEIALAATGQEVLELLRHQSFDCMILDLGLTDMSGFEVLRSINASPTLRRLPVIVYTGRELTEEDEIQIKKYAESIIVKGVRSPERLLEETSLYLHRVDASLTENRQDVDTELQDRDTNLAGRTVLLVDDDMRNVFALSHVLEEKGIQVIVARDGQESLTRLNATQGIELVLMDIMMPNMDGYEAMRTIRRDPQFASLPIIALTAKAMKGDRNKCIEAGANDYLAKPVDAEKLLSLLRVWLYRP
ncbi:hypothetical protein MASR1M90_14680 [Desulfovibrionales bacterium]